MDCWFGFEYRVCHCMGLDNIYFDEEKEEFDNDKINKKILHEYFDNVEPIYDRTEAYKKAIELLRDNMICEYGIVSVDLQEPYLCD